MEAINWHSFFFLLFALLACGFAVAVVPEGVKSELGIGQQVSRRRKIGGPRCG